MDLNSFLAAIGQDDSLDFKHSMEVIQAHYDYQPSGFTNGKIRNEAGQNEGSCKIFAFAKLNALSEAQTLACFGGFYRDVLNAPQGTDHGNIRAFMATGWDGVAFDAAVLTRKG
ncbi:HopJ type III effector protein [Marinobacterium sedimentorum]|uniref:HopJ type III effector protein n=1 Tax=Marinobacterium sedimentorum TaxID=2927804 RepID=UPI0020C6C489|nr:HopJ type III effector protein [Marinobacterium sedimentorum]MCP8688163.1 HopJ type III effector protein [Marinobacterium sedimentorum]